jgi:hypothetical protein
MLCLVVSHHSEKQILEQTTTRFSSKFTYRRQGSVKIHRTFVICCLSFIVAVIKEYLHMSYVYIYLGAFF